MYRAALLLVLFVLAAIQGVTAVPTLTSSGLADVKSQLSCFRSGSGFHDKGINEVQQMFMRSRYQLLPRSILNADAPSYGGNIWIGSHMYFVSLNPTADDQYAHLLASDEVFNFARETESGVYCEYRDKEQVTHAFALGHISDLEENEIDCDPRGRVGEVCRGLLSNVLISGCAQA